MTSVSVWSETQVCVLETSKRRGRVWGMVISAPAWYSPFVQDLSPFEGNVFFSEHEVMAAGQEQKSPPPMIAVGVWLVAHWQWRTLVPAFFFQGCLAMSDVRAFFMFRHFVLHQVGGGVT